MQEYQKILKSKPMMEMEVKSIVKLQIKLGPYLTFYTKINS